MNFNSLGGRIIVLVWCLFMGVTVGSIAVGAVYPPANLLAKPFVCLNGAMKYNQATSNPRPGTTVTTTTWTCVDSRTGQITELGIFPMSLYAGLIYGFLFYVVVLGVQLYSQRRQVAPTAPVQTRPARRPATSGNANANAGHRPPHPAAAQPNVVARMQRLEELRAANLISEAEYQQKRADILKEV